MRILILDTSPIRRGAQVFGLDLATALTTLGMEVSRVYLFQANQSEVLPVGTHDSVLPFREDSCLEKIPSFQPRLLMSLKKRILEFQPQVILCNGSKSLKYGAWVRMFNDVPTAKWVARFIDDAVFWNPTGLKKLAYSIWLDQFDALVGVSQHSLDSVLNHYDFKKPSKVIHRVFDPRKFKNAPNRKTARAMLGLEEEDEVLLFLGNLTAQKRPDRFIEVVAKLSQTRSKVKAVLVGDGLLREELENQVAAIRYQEERNTKQKLAAGGNDAKDSNVLHLTSSIYFTGYQQDVSPYLAASDILVLTSDTEGLPGVVLEAGFFEVPTVSSDVGGLRECLIDGETGFLIKDRSVSGFVEQISFLLDHPERKKEMGQRAKHFIDKNFRMDEVVSQYLSFFQSLTT